MIPDDYVIATGVEHSIRDFLDAAFQCVDIKDWEKFVIQDERFMRPAEVAVLCGDSTKARDVLGWKLERLRLKKWFLTWLLMT